MPTPHSRHSRHHGPGPHPSLSMSVSAVVHIQYLRSRQADFIDQRPGTPHSDAKWDEEDKKKVKVRPFFHVCLLYVQSTGLIRSGPHFSPSLPCAIAISSSDFACKTISMAVILTGTTVSQLDLSYPAFPVLFRRISTLDALPIRAKPTSVALNRKDKSCLYHNIFGVLEDSAFTQTLGWE